MSDNNNWCADGASASEVLHRAAARIDSRLDQRLSAVGLTSRQFLLLKCVAANDGVNQVGLSKQSGIDRSTMTDMVGRLVNRGLLAREKKPNDTRAYCVMMTDSGRQHLAQAEPMVREIDRAVMEALEPDARNTFLQVLRAISETPE
jgi:DNA-binding MarR family transcriptional regulator